MSQYVSGELGQTHRHDLGEFISIPYKYGTWRFRADTILHYADMSQAEHPAQKDHPENHFILSVVLQGCGQVGLQYDSAEEVRVQAERLDWHFKKERRE